MKFDDTPLYIRNKKGEARNLLKTISKKSAQEVKEESQTEKMIREGISRYKKLKPSNPMIKPEPEQKSSVKTYNFGESKLKASVVLREEEKHFLLLSGGLNVSLDRQPDHHSLLKKRQQTRLRTANTMKQRSLLKFTGT